MGTAVPIRLMSEEPSLPWLPDGSWYVPCSPYSDRPAKRSRLSRAAGDAPPLSFNSSDPAVFSSDDDPGLDNYVEGRRKNRYVGSWFQQRLASSDSTFGEGPVDIPRQTKRTLKRDFDSGVYLGSDATDGEDLMEGLDKPPQLERRLAPQMKLAEKEARDMIQKCLDNGGETVDFWCLGLEELSDETIELLAQVSCIPVVTRDVAFVQREPELQLFMAMNHLTRVPSRLFDLTFLTALSFRGNQLTELPAAISQLHNLKQLNLSQNRLNYLPAEFLDLLIPGGKLLQLSLFVNPFWQPERKARLRGPNQSLPAPFPDMRHKYRRILRDDEITPFSTLWLGRSPLQWSDSNGRVISDFQFVRGKEPAGRAELPVEAVNDRAEHLSVTRPPPSSLNSHNPDTRPSAVPSLIELALRSCLRSSQLRDLESYIPDDFSPLKKLVQQASSQKETGRVTCSGCRRTIVVPSFSWIEFRELRTYIIDTRWGDQVSELLSKPFTSNREESVVPFLHRACSWRCRPRDAVHNDTFWTFPPDCYHAMKMPRD